MFWRVIQAFGSSSGMSVGAGVIGDISTRAERGGFFGLYSLGPMVCTVLVYRTTYANQHKGRACNRACYRWRSG